MVTQRKEKKKRPSAPPRKGKTGTAASQPEALARSVPQAGAGLPLAESAASVLRVGVESSASAINSAARFISENPVLAATLVVFFFRPLVSGRTFISSNCIFSMLLFPLGGLWALSLIRKGTLQLKALTMTAMLGLFMLIAMLSFAWTFNRNETWRGLMEFVAYFVLFLFLTNSLNHNSQRRVVTSTVSLASIAVCLYGVYSFLVGLELLRVLASQSAEYIKNFLVIDEISPSLLDRIRSNEVFSTFIHSGILGGFLIMTTPVMAGVMMDSATRFKKVFWSCGLALNIMILYLSFARGAWLAMTVASMVWLVLFAIKKGFSKQKRLLAAVMGCVVVGLLGGAALTLYKEKRAAASPMDVANLTGNKSTAQEPTGQTQESKPITGKTYTAKELASTATMTLRFSYWRGTLNMIKAHPILGVGFSAWTTAYPQYMEAGGYPVRLAHNNYLQVLAETGVLGGVLFLAVCILFLVRGWRIVTGRVGSDFQWTAAGLYVGVFAFLVHSLVDFDLYDPGVAIFFFAFMAILCSFEPQESPAFLRSSSVGIAISILGIAGFVAAALPLAADWQSDRRGKSIDRKLHVAERIAAGMEMDNPSMLRDVFTASQWKAIKESQGDNRVLVSKLSETLENTIPQLQKALSYYPFDEELHRSLGLMYEHLGKFRNSTAYLDKAVEEYRQGLNQVRADSYLHYLIGRTLWLKSEMLKTPSLNQEILKEFESAKSNFPTSAGYTDALATFCQRSGLEDRAQKLFEEAKYLASIEKGRD